MEQSEVIAKMVDDILADNNVDAKDAFEELVQARLTDALDVKKKEIAASLYDKAEVKQEEEPA
jgi:hypothetical protein